MFPADPIPGSRFDLEQLALNGLRRGFTTGSCATAAVKAALLHLLCRESPAEVLVHLPVGGQYLILPITAIDALADGSVRAEVIKDAGDDPDQTHKAHIFARVKRNNQGTIRFCRGDGVGLVTQAGLQIPIGEPAINPVPRQMMIQAVRDVLAEGDGIQDEGFDLEIGCENGSEIAKRTFNPRLGIVGGISILGTTGIVEPKSMAAFQASIAIYIRVALGDNPAEIVLTPGNLGQRFARSSLNIPLKCVVQMSNFVGFALESLETTLGENSHELPLLWLAGHPGKIAKLLDGTWDTHSQQSTSAVAAVCQVAKDFGIGETLLAQFRTSTTVEGIIELLKLEPNAAEFWSEVERRIAAIVLKRLARVRRVAVRLFQMDGTVLGQITT